LLPTASRMQLQRQPTKRKTKTENEESDATRADGARA
jgi:hypothetical protein